MTKYLIGAALGFCIGAAVQYAIKGPPTSETLGLAYNCGQVAALNNMVADKLPERAWCAEYRRYAK